MTGPRRAGLIGAAAIAAVLAFLLLRPSDDGGPVPARDPAARQEPAATPPRSDGGEPGSPGRAEPEVTRLRVRRAEPVGGVARIEAEKGDTVRITVSSDSAQHVHLHGYDVVRDAAPGAPARFRFKADLEGIFEMELEGPGVQLAELRVEP